MKNLSNTMLAAIVLFLLPLFCFADNSLNVIINEIAWMGTNISANDEWIELYNNTNSDIDLNDWKLIVKDGVPEINLNGKILAQDFFILERTDDTTVPDIPSNIIYTGALNNNGEYLQLIDEQGNIIDEIDCLPPTNTLVGGWIAGDNKTKQTMERVGNKWQTSKEAGGSPGKKNTKTEAFPTPGIEELTPQASRETPGVDLDGIIINEVLPSPEGPDAENEYIEIYNKNDFEADISYWQIQDVQGKIKVFIFPFNTTIQGLNYLVFYRPQTKITLNNSGDRLKLLKPNAEIADEIYYEKTEIGQSFNKIGEIWEWSENLTPGKENAKTEVEPQNQETKTEVRPQEKPEVGPQNEELPQIPNNFFSILLTGLPISLGSGGLILALKRKMKYHKNIKYVN